MEGKTVFLSVLIMSLVMAQFQVEATICCPSTTARDRYNICRTLGGGSTRVCEQISGCKTISGSKCDPGWNSDILQNSGDSISEYCKLGCTSTVCGAMTTLQNSDASEIVNGAVEQCTKACSTFCTKGSKIAI